MLTRLQLIPTGQRSHEDLDRTPEVAVGTASIEFRGFDQHLIRPARLWTSLLASVGVHGVAFTSAWIIMQILPTAGTAPPLRYRVTYEPVTTFLQIRPAVEVRRPVQRAAAAAGGAAESLASAEKTLHAPAEQATAEGGGTPRILREFQLPDAPHRVESEQTLLQPDAPPIWSLSRCRVCRNCSSGAPMQFRKRRHGRNWFYPGSELRWCNSPSLPLLHNYRSPHKLPRPMSRRRSLGWKVRN